MQTIVMLRACFMDLLARV